MTQEEKELLLKDLCARLPYGVKCEVCFQNELYTMILKTGLPNSFGNFDFENEECSLCSDDFKPYLRPMSSMTEEEKDEMKQISSDYLDEWEKAETVIDRWKLDAKSSYNRSTFYNSHYLDWSGLIEKGLALEAPENMYDIKTE